jgi:hypothetical protein
MTGVKLLIGSYGSFDLIAGMVVCDVAVNKRVYPLGSDLDT